MVSLIGLGCGGPDLLTREALLALEQAEVLIGAKRLLSAVPDSSAEKVCEYRPREILERIRVSAEKRICVVYSGDTGFYSGASKLTQLLESEGIPYKILPGLSSVQVFAARLSLPWQDWKLCSAHGVDCDPVQEVRGGRDVFFLTGGTVTPTELCAALTEAGLGFLPAAAGEDLSYASERIRQGTAAQFAGERFAPLSVLLVRAGSEDQSGQTQNSPAVQADGTVFSGARLMISAMGSGSGKTVLTCGLLAALKRRGIACEAFKCGPDYIDPMFHTRVSGVPCRNLDLFLQGRKGLLKTLKAQRRPIALIEGAMGYYDGVAGTTQDSAWEIAREGRIPVILAVRPEGSSATLAAQIKGMMQFRDPDRIAGLILTVCRPALYDHLRPVLERETALPVLGYLPPMKEAELKSRHLGLWTAGEVADLRERLEAVAVQTEKTVDLDRLLSLCVSERLPGTLPSGPLMHTGKPACTVAVARDEAFCFYYEDSLDALREAGAELCFFSPIRDRHLPPCERLYLGGGYPELYARELSENTSMRESIAEALRGGLPVLAECGGFLYLQQSLEDPEGRRYPMAGVLPGEGIRTGRLQRFGYAWLKPEKDSLLFRAGETIPVHEFHYWDSTENGTDLPVEKPDGRRWKCGFVSPVMYAAFPHLHLGGELPLAARFVKGPVL